MRTFSVPTHDEVSPASQLLFDILKRRAGKVPNLYAVMGYSPSALKGFMNLDEALNDGIFTSKEREAVALVVSQVNGCDYCLAGHTILAIKRGFTKEETLDIRRGEVGESRLNAIVQLAKAVTETKGRPADKYLNSFYEAGFDDGALMELVGLVTVRVFTNYVFALTNVPIDFPVAEPLIK
jgi:uncharacterized peroxidase-related enzyme